MEIKRDFILDPSLVLYLPLYLLDGDSFMSKDAYGHLGTVTGALWRPNGRYFDGVDDFINVPHQASLNLGNTGGTIIVWAKLDDLGHYHGLIQKDDSNPGPYVPYALYVNGTNVFVGEVGDGSSGKTMIIGTASIGANIWYHFALTFSQTTGQIYIDANIEKSSALSPAPGNNTEDIWVGKMETATNKLKGLMGEVWIYNRPLTPVEIQHNYLATKWRYR